jgi:hypothetical protein
MIIVPSNVAQPPVVVEPPVEPPPTGSGVQFDAVTTIYQSGTGALPAWTHTAGAGTSLVIVAICTRGASTATATYGGVAMTSVVSFSPRDSINIFQLFNPPQGTQTINVTNTGSARNIAAISYRNCSSIGQTYTLAQPSTLSAPIDYPTGGNSIFLTVGTNRNLVTLGVSNSVTRGFIGTPNTSIWAESTGGSVTCSCSATSSTWAGIQITP